MFFSVIIPSYNPRPFLQRLLDSIVHNKCINEVEIIISDDCSTEPFDDIIKNYTNLNIRMISNEVHAGFPRNGRQHGADEAKGQWICFSDQDDYFVDNAFDKVKDFIEKNNVHNYLISNFIMEDTNNNLRTVEDGTKGWTHGKFYEKIFWDKYNMGYDKYLMEYCRLNDMSTQCRTCAV